MKNPLMPDMRIAIFTQDDPLFVPHALGPLLIKHGHRTSALYLSGTGKRRQSRLAEIWRYVVLFGVFGFLRLVGKVIRARWLSHWHRYGGLNYPITPRDMADFCDIPVRHVRDMESAELTEELREEGVDLIVSVSYNWIFPKKLIETPPLGVINIHNAPLPHYRGLMPAFWQLLHDETQSAATIHQMVPEIDAGDILGWKDVPIVPEDTWESLVIRSKRISGELVSDVIDQFEACANEGRTLEGKPMDVGEGSYYSFPGFKDARAFRRKRRFWGRVENAG